MGLGEWKLYGRKEEKVGIQLLAKGLTQTYGLNYEEEVLNGAAFIYHILYYMERVMSMDHGEGSMLVVCFPVRLIVTRVYGLWGRLILSALLVQQAVGLIIVAGLGKSFSWHASREVGDDPSSLDPYHHSIRQNARRERKTSPQVINVAEEHAETVAC
ncbi:hypothetical protein SDJN03_00133, partial [Cucurbita argyrosperma subsp. sororia]